jgi:hypothetical protein
MKIPIPDFRGRKPEIDDAAAEQLGRSAVDQVPKEVVHIDGSELLGMLCDVATNAWKAQVRLKNWNSEETQSEGRRLERNVDAIMTSLEQFGVRVKDHTGEAYDYGQPIKVVAAQSQPGIDREVVTETIRPSVYWRTHTLQRGEVVIATPIEGQG